MLSLPRELVEAVADSPGVTFTLYRTCKRLRDDLRGTFTVRIITAIIKSVAIYTKKSTGVVLMTLIDGPNVRISNGKMLTPPAESAITVRHRNTQVWINEKSLLLTTPGGILFYFGIADDLPHVRGLLYLQFSDIYRITRVNYNPTGMGILVEAASGKYTIATVDNANIRIYHTDIHPADIPGVALTLELV